MKYRILKIEKMNAIGENIVKYEVQKKFLWWYFTCSISLCTNFLGTYKGSYHNRTPIERFLAIYDKKEDAIACMEQLSNPFEEFYKGCKIVLLRKERDDYFLFVNLNNCEYQKVGSGYIAGYECNRSLEELKKAIDARIFLIKKTIL